MVQAAPPCSPLHSRVAAALRAGHASGRARRRSKLRLAGPGGARRATEGVSVGVTSSGLIMSRLGQVSLTKPTYRRIVLRCCSVPQAKPSPDYEYRISLRPHPGGHPSSSTWDSASRTVPSSIRVRRDGYREAGEWQQAGGDQRDRAAQKVFVTEPGPGNRAAISIRSARPPIITVIGASGLAYRGGLKCHPSAN